MTRALRVGTRGSRLARIQSELVAGRLRAAGREVEIVEIVTEGDRRAPGTPFGEGVFVAAIERALLAGEVDVAVHSAKDVPLVEQPALAIAAYPERADPRDAVVSREEGKLDDLVEGAVLGTDSPRRAGFALHRRPGLGHVALFGNVDTRLSKLDAGEADALILACAGLDRLGCGARIAERLDPRTMAPAPGQGALAVQCRAGDGEVTAAVKAIDDGDIRLAVVAERAVLAGTGGTCRSPVGAVAEVVRGRLRLLAAAAAPDGSEFELVELEADAELGAVLGIARAAARRLAEKVRLTA